MVKAACSQGEFLNRLLELVHDVWRDGYVPNDWRDAILIPIPKKGHLTSCVNWRGICLLDVVGGWSYANEITEAGRRCITRITV